ncbi:MULTISPECIES: flagellar hook-length control protein FliK [unclassified Mesorhizobium]|uniref:flagellar hook-length control protein FliK n=1 Tax=unclassified Mesorhizobium TaxID=325217 RepID=UPI000FCBA49B|nr:MULTISPECIES: flagellar hook-length control protein FliK [unclassified Mesorhizobium]TGP23801.1 flagellar hook-length control protein FliK [Mesorhizobium sp. M1D.F.Ca.ET.231.01.1.1]TGP33945.1 flagellar hook-length control protein FliK [Mesorhizobium sp. M1D.F.Ca.ET.234.01.1.1]TGS47310.1 flagellar hook-length control protein FliK [Mesorhizobium sp. M1D.F.Ca.ET.184.01.1.1]TGS62570.1 flagellar hook-length control protein FliK [Mesorhizobium sp. M1D.F.Ca.ET.183.01.1.1]
MTSAQMNSAQMNSVSQAMPGLGSTHTQSRQHAADGKGKGSNFGEMVHGAERSARQGKRPVEPASSDANPARRALAGSPEVHADQQNKTATQKLAAGKAARHNADTGHGKATDDADTPAQSSDAAALQDGLPLLMALGDIRHFATAANGGRDGSAEGEAGTQPSIGQSAASQLTIRQGKRALADASEGGEPLPRSSRATMATEEPGPDFGQKPAGAGPGGDTLVRKDDVLPATPGIETDAAAPQSWRPAAAQKTAQTAQSIASINQARPSSGRMDVVSQQSFPAPAQNPIGQTASALLEAIASDSGVQQAFASASIASQTANSVAVPTHVLKIELHPAELGMVVASLRLSGEQLSIEMKPETHEAFRRLSADSDAIVKSLRGLGFDVDHVTIMQPSIAAHSAGRADASAMPMSTGRDQPSFQPGNSGGNGASGDRQPGRNDGNGAQEFGRAAPPLRERAGDDIYI